MIGGDSLAPPENALSPSQPEENYNKSYIPVITITVLYFITRALNVNVKYSLPWLCLLSSRNALR